MSEAPSYFQRLQSGGCGPDAVHITGGPVVTPSQVMPRRGGHAEGLRRRCGDAAGVQLGGSLVDRVVVNAGSDLVLSRSRMGG